MLYTNRLLFLTLLSSIAHSAEVPSCIKKCLRKYKDEVLERETYTDDEGYSKKNSWLDHVCNNLHKVEDIKSCSQAYCSAWDECASKVEYGEQTSYGDDEKEVAADYVDEEKKEDDAAYENNDTETEDSSYTEKADDTTYGDKKDDDESYGHEEVVSESTDESYGDDDKTHHDDDDFIVYADGEETEEYHGEGDDGAYTEDDLTHHNDVVYDGDSDHHNDEVYDGESDHHEDKYGSGKLGEFFADHPFSVPFDGHPDSGIVTIDGDELTGADVPVVVSADAVIGQSATQANEQTSNARNNAVFARGLVLFVFALLFV